MHACTFECIQSKTESDGTRLNALIRSLRVDFCKTYVTFRSMEKSNPIAFSFFLYLGFYRNIAFIFWFWKILVEKFPRKTILLCLWNTNASKWHTNYMSSVHRARNRLPFFFNFRVLKCFNEFQLFISFEFDRERKNFSFSCEGHLEISLHAI